MTVLIVESFYILDDYWIPPLFKIAVFKTKQTHFFQPSVTFLNLLAVFMLLASTLVSLRLFLKCHAQNWMIYFSWSPVTAAQDRIKTSISNLWHAT